MEKTFDCLKMKEEIQAKIYEEIKDMSFAEHRAYLDKSLENDAWWQRLRARDEARKRDGAVQYGFKLAEAAPAAALCEEPAPYQADTPAKT